MPDVPVRRLFTSTEPFWFEQFRYSISPKLQYTRAAHLTSDCVNYGQCEDICPMEIPLSAFFHQSRKEYARLFEKFDSMVSGE